MGDSGEFLDEGGESFPAIKFESVGATCVGTIMSEPHTVIRESLKDGSPEKQLPINLETSDGPRTLWVRKGFLQSALKKATEAAGVKGLQPGGKLSVKFTELRDTGKPQPAKVFAAKYEPPAAPAVDVNDIFDSEEPF